MIGFTYDETSGAHRHAEEAVKDRRLNLLVITSSTEVIIEIHRDFQQDKHTASKTPV